MENALPASKRSLLRMKERLFISGPVLLRRDFFAFLKEQFLYIDIYSPFSLLLVNKLNIEAW